MIRDRLTQARVSAPAAGRLGRALHRPHRRHRAQAVHLRRRRRSARRSRSSTCPTSTRTRSRQARHEVDRGRGRRTTTTLIEKYLDGEELTIDEIRHAIRKATVARQHRPGALRRLVQEQGRAGAARRGDRLPAVAGRRAARSRATCRITTSTFEERAVHGRRAVRGARVQDRDRSVRRKADVLPRVLGRAQVGLVRLQLDEGQARARRPSAADAREQARGDRGSARRRHRRRDRTQGHAHRRHDVRRRASDHPRGDEVPEPRHRRRDRAEDEGRPGQARRSRCRSCRKKIRRSASTRTRRRRRRSSPAWASCTSRSSSTA